ncbi:hypothetical protein [Candidatus Sodalis sp. SoCistrobi]|uniref:allophanate hydrolase-related protein n=1 Tax=Candidatus Sodalis sp. SoCistrobi TaxID=1922216 RepID=UPI0009402B05
MVVAPIPAPLGIGTLQWGDGEWLRGFICEPCALAGSRDGTAYGGWCRYSEERERSRRPATWRC